MDLKNYKINFANYIAIKSSLNFSGTPSIEIEGEVEKMFDILLDNNTDRYSVNQLIFNTFKELGILEKIKNK